MFHYLCDRTEAFFVVALNLLVSRFGTQQSKQGSNTGSDHILNHMDISERLLIADQEFDWKTGK